MAAYLAIIIFALLLKKLNNPKEISAGKEVPNKS